MNTTVTTYDIRVYPLVLKFLSYHFPTDPFLISSVKNPYASYLDGCLDRYDIREKEMPKKYDQLTSLLTVGISNWHIKRTAASRLSPKKVAAFNDFVRQMFFEKLTSEVALHTSLGAGVKTATSNFLDRYAISEDELPIEIALRYYGKKRRKMLLNYCPVSSPEELALLPHERDSADWQMEPWRGQAA